jgi:hypothetical protein
MARWFDWVEGTTLPPVVVCIEHIMAAVPGRGRDWGTLIPPSTRWPLRNVHLGVSAENQACADERIPHLLTTPATVRLVSAEPLLGPIVFDPAWLTGEYPARDWGGQIAEELGAKIDGIILGGESGPGARTCDVGWIRGIMEQVQPYGTKVFLKQLGARPRARAPEDMGPAAYRAWDAQHAGEPFPTEGVIVPMRGKGGDPADWPEDLRVRDLP